jgi:hypothetical protein
MDGKHRNPSLALVFASVPVQALLMAGVAAAVLGGASSSTVQYGYSVQVNPANGQPSYTFVKPVQGCWDKGAGAFPGGLPYPVAKPGDPMCAYALPAVPDGAQIVNVPPCCGYSAP